MYVFPDLYSKIAAEVLGNGAVDVRALQNGAQFRLGKLAEELPFPVEHRDFEVLAPFQKGDRLLTVQLSDRATFLISMPRFMAAERSKRMRR